jgi:predicted DNA-binding transcriptional regulator
MDWQSVLVIISCVAGILGIAYTGWKALSYLLEIKVSANHIVSKVDQMDRQFNQDRQTIKEQIQSIKYDIHGDIAEIKQEIKDDSSKQWARISNAELAISGIMGRIEKQGSGILKTGRGDKP